MLHFSLRGGAGGPGGKEGVGGHPVSISDCALQRGFLVQWWPLVTTKVYFLSPFSAAPAMLSQICRKELTQPYFSTWKKNGKTIVWNIQAHIVRRPAQHCSLLALPGE